ncbi:MAG TPA: AAA family ATPase, partial [Thermomicrobiales bacterium]|nr:AAA family ATPase [Thermomicrobiales bacterium]
MRLVSLTGPGGVGKTRLALQVAAELAPAFADGAAFVDLAPIRDPGLVASTIGQALGIRGDAGQSAADALRLALRERHLLLVLDNFEHLLAAAPLATALLMACPHLIVLATSRMPLRLAGERLFPAPPLTLPRPHAGGAPSAADIAPSEAVALFVQHVQASDPEFRLTDANAGAVADICRQLDGLPLAIELAAARTRLFTPQALAERLGHRLPLLTAGPRDAPERQRTLRSTIDWSYDLLSPAAQALFRRLSVFAGGFTLEAAACANAARSIMDAAAERGDDGPTLDLVASLVDQNLLRRENGHDGAPRFTMLETIREYGMERLTQSGDEAATREAHAAFHLALCERAEPALLGGEQDAWVARLEAEAPNLRVALAWLRDGGDAERTLRLAGAVGLFWTLPH